MRMHTDQETAPVVTDMATWRSEMQRLWQRTGPTFVHLRAQLPLQGRTNQLLAASPNLSVVLKTYASGGENELHAHTNEDHAFLVLQGGATFHGPQGESRKVAQHDCVLIPRNSLYWFVEDEDADPLVLVRFGAAIDPSTDVNARVGSDGAAFDGFSEANKEVPIVLGPRWFE